MPPEARIAVFDNDGTLWAEQPMYVQLDFAFDRVKTLAPQHPEWQEKEPFASVLRGDVKGAFAGGSHALGELLLAASAGNSTDEYAAIVDEWMAVARHPTTKKPYPSMVYQPMVELLRYLRDRGFATYIVSGGGVDFIRPWADRVYGIPPEQVVGSRIETRFEMLDGRPTLLREPAVDFVDDGPGKPVGIQQRIGRRPIAAFGNSDGDLEMLQYTCLAPGPTFCLYVRHTDAEREWAYDRTSPIGKLDRGLDEAAARGWTVVDMKRDWARIWAGD